MDAGSLATVDWGALSLVVLIAAGLVWAFVFFLRKNRDDYDSLQETLKSEDDDEQSP